MLVSEHNKLFGTTKTEDKVKRELSNMTTKITTKITTKKFPLVSKYANYLTWDEKQNAPYNFNFF